MIKVQNVFVNMPWIKFFEQYAGIENTYHKSKVMRIGAQVLGVIVKPAACSLIMDIVELAITLNRCEEIKIVLKSNLIFSTIEEFKELLQLQLQKEELK